MRYVNARGSYNPRSTTFDLISGDVIVHEHVADIKRVQLPVLHTQGRADECGSGRDRQMLSELLNLKSSPLDTHLWNFYFQKTGGE